MHWQRVLGHDGALTIVNAELFRVRTELAASQQENRDIGLRNGPSFWRKSKLQPEQRLTHSEDAAEESNSSSNWRGIFQFGNTANTNPQDSPNEPGIARDPRDMVFQPKIGRPGGLRVGATLAELHAPPSQASPLPNEFRLRLVEPYYASTTAQNQTSRPTHHPKVTWT